MRDAWIIGGGLAAATLCQEFAKHKVECHVFEKEERWGGLIRTRRLKGVIYEPHGSHILHTDDEEVWNLVNEIGPYNDYEHRVQTMIENKLVRWPIMEEDLLSLSFGKESLEYIQDRERMIARTGADPAPPDSNFEEWCLRIMTIEMYDAFIKPYTEKQWGVPATELAATFAPKRVQVRTDGDDRLFKDRFQGYPDATKGHSYEAQLRVMFGKAKIHLASYGHLDTLMTLLKETPKAWRPSYIIVTVPLDDFADNVYGELAWRGLDFSAKYVRDDHVQDRMVVNWPGKEFAWIRTHEAKHASRQVVDGTVLVTEFTGGEGRYYPVPGKGGKLRETNDKYQDFVKDTLEYMGPKVECTGRLANFKYQDMDEVIRDSLDTARALLG